MDTNFPNNYLESKLGRTYHELEFFKSNDYSNTKDCFYQKMKFTNTTLGNYYLKNILLNPITNTNVLTNRQNIILKLETSFKNNNTLSQETLDLRLKQLSSIENGLLSYYRPETEELKAILDTIYFQFAILKPLNYNESFLNMFNYMVMYISPFYGIVSPIIMLVLPVLVMKYVLKSDISITTYFKIMKNMFFKTSSTTNVFKTVLDNCSKNIENTVLKFSVKLFSFIIYLINSPFGRYGYLGMIFVTYLYSIYNYFTTTKNMNKIINYLHTYINRLRTCLDSVYNIYTQIRCLESTEHKYLVR